MMSIHVPDHGIKNKVLRQPLPASLSVRVRLEDAHAVEDALDRVHALSEPLLGIVCGVQTRKNLVAMIQLVSRRETPCHRSASRLTIFQLALCQLDSRRQDAHPAGDFICDFLRPMLPRVLGRIFEQPVALMGIIRISIPELVLAAHLLRARRPAKMNIHDRIR